MRIITGELRGRRLRSPSTDNVRPTSDRVKEAVFSMIMPYLSPGFVAVDLFTGSGNLGLEAVSRGASTVYFSDDSRESIALAKTNIKTCGVENRAVLLAGDYRHNISRIRQSVDIYFLDPPYAMGYLLPALDAIREAGNLKPGGLVVCEHSHKDSLPEEIEGYELVTVRKYGATGVTIYRRPLTDREA